LARSATQVPEVRALERAADDVRQRDRAGDPPVVEDREAVLVLALEPFELAVDGVEALVARRLERREERAVLDQKRRELVRIAGRERADHRATTRR
jgi:hypothetical protein